MNQQEGIKNIINELHNLGFEYVIRNINIPNMCTMVCHHSWVKWGFEKTCIITLVNHEFGTKIIMEKDDKILERIVSNREAACLYEWALNEHLILTISDMRKMLGYDKDCGFFEGEYVTDTNKNDE